MLAGSCLCGAIRFQLSGFILGCHACHCRFCKKYHGTAHSTVMIGLASNLTWLQGADELSYFEVETPNPRAFCRHCGSPMPGVSRNGMAAVHAGTLDVDPEIPLSHHIFTKYRPTWAPQVVETCYQDYMPPDEALSIWRSIAARPNETEDDLIEFMRVCDRTEGFRQWWDESATALEPPLPDLMIRARALNAADG